MPDVITTIREWVGTQPDDGTIGALFADHNHDPLRTALSILRTRYADMTANPAKWAVVDDYSQDTTANLEILASRIQRLEILTGETSTSSSWVSTRICGPSIAR